MLSRVRPHAAGSGAVFDLSRIEAAEMINAVKPRQGTIAGLAAHSPGSSGLSFLRSYCYLLAAWAGFTGFHSLIPRGSYRQSGSVC